jgi:triacylglycerol lipase
MKRTCHLLKLLIFVILGMFLIIPSVQAFGDDPPEPDANDYPIVLVHGFVGWGRSEMTVGNLTLYHWGGFTDIQEELKANGSEVYTAEMGPFSSNWDRACELYAEIMNNPEVDYGQAHAAKFGHLRFKDNPLYVPNGDNWFNGKEKIHLICHSMGASTARMLVDLLEEGCLEEMNASDDTSPLFDISQDTTNLVHSVTTISGINNGTTLANCISDLIPCVQELVAGIGAAAGGLNCDNPIYDFKMEQFGLVRGDLDWETYWDNFLASSVLDTDDICLYDLKPTGMYEINGWVEAHPNVYYFSYTTEQTYRRVWPAPHYELPRLDMFPFLMPFGLMMGTYSGTLDYGIVIDSQWWMNDGVVNTYAQKSPLPEMNSMDMVTEYNGTPQIGIWNHMGLLDSDHWDIMGCGFEGITGPYGTKSRLMNFYNDLESMLHDLN